MDSALLQSFVWTERPAPAYLSTGIPELDFPRGCLTEICGPASSGRTSMLFSVMAQATASENMCALVDANDALDPISAAAAGVDLQRLLWVRCGGNAEHALKATDLLASGGGFGIVVMDLGDTSPRTAQCISLASWFRLRRAVEHTPTVLIVVTQKPSAKTCASLVIEMRRNRVIWSGLLLRGFEGRWHKLKPQPAKVCSLAFTR